MKTLIVILGAGASGKSTLTRALCGKEPHEGDALFQIEGKQEKAKYTIFQNGAAIAGNYKNGSDSISSMEARARLINLLLDQPSVEFVITDGVRSSKKWDVDWVQANRHDLAVVYVYIDLPEEENLRRLIARRTANGKEGMDPKTFENMKAFRDRAAGVWKAANVSYTRQPVRFVRINEGVTPQEASRQVRTEIKLLYARLEEGPNDARGLPPLGLDIR